MKHLNSEALAIALREVRARDIASLEYAVEVGIRSYMSATTGPDTAALLEKAEKALEPFCLAVESLADDHRDTSEIWESSAAMSITAGDLRAARSALSDIRKAQS